MVETETCTATRTIWEEEWTEVGRTAEGSASVGGSVGRVPNGADLGVHGHCERFGHCGRRSLLCLNSVLSFIFYLNEDSY